MKAKLEIHSSFNEEKETTELEVEIQSREDVDVLLAFLGIADSLSEALEISLEEFLKMALYSVSAYEKTKNKFKEKLYKDIIS